MSWKERDMDWGNPYDVEEYDVDEDGNIMDDQYYRDRDADEWYARMKDEGGFDR